MPALRRARRGRSQNLQKSTQVEASGEANSSIDSVSLPMFIIQHAYHSGCLRIERPSLTYPAASPFKGYFALQNPAIGMSTDFQQITQHTDISRTKSTAGTVLRLNCGLDSDRLMQLGGARFATRIVSRDQTWLASLLPANGV